ncbi:hypothetical protein FRC17_004821, partial [Serendipita sp. 399]
LDNVKFSASSTTLIALHAPAPRLQLLFDRLSKFSSANIGCLSAPVSSRYPISLSLLNIPSSIEHRIWRSTIPGKERAQVGRWYSQEQIKREKDDQATRWSPNSSLDAARIGTLPPTLQDLVNTKQLLSGLLFFTDDASQGLSASLNHHFPETAKASNHLHLLGLFASSTPFITGRPFTLFESESIHSDGAVGVAIVGPKPLEIESNFSSLMHIGGSLLITSASSNMIYTMNERPAADTLAQLIETQFNASSANRPAVHLGVLDDQEKIYRVFSVLAGSPSRGALLLDGEKSPMVGSKAQFLVSSREIMDYDENFPSPSAKETSTLDAQFACVSYAEANTGHTMTHDSEVTIIENQFLVASENGLLIDKGKGLWECKVPFVGASIKL